MACTIVCVHLCSIQRSFMSGSATVFTVPVIRIVSLRMADMAVMGAGFVR